MSRKPEQLETAGRYHGFSLESVCWGYRDIFRKTLDELLRSGTLGPARETSTQHFFDLLTRADRSCFDHVLKEFLGAVNPRTRWMLDLPAIFSEVTTTGRELAETKLFYGITYFRILGEGGFGDTPRRVRYLMDQVARLRRVDDDLAMAFLKGYGTLTSRMTVPEIDRFVREGIRMFHGNRNLGLVFMEGSSKAADNVIRSLTRECRLEDVNGPLTALMRALVGYDVDVADLSQLDSDDLIERGSSVVCMYRWLYVPAVVRAFGSSSRNRAWYFLLAAVAAGMLSEHGFCCLHGHPAYTTCRDLVGPDSFHLNAFQVVETVRVLKAMRNRWPGVRRLLDLAIETETRETPARGPGQDLLYDTIGDAVSAAAARAHALAALSRSSLETARLVRDLDSAGPLAPLNGPLLSPLSFVPDFLFPGRVESASQDALVADLKRSDRARQHDEDSDRNTARPEPGGDKSGGDGDEDAAVEACYLYDEWSQPENDYYRDHCRLHEQVPGVAAKVPGPEEMAAEEVRQVRRIFERLKPQLSRREKNLADGDRIDTDKLVTHIVERRVEPSPSMDFYEKPQRRLRDLAVLLLLDVSGSTGENSGGRKRVIDIERRAALILGTGLHALGDRFSVCGFSGNGRENCLFLVFKDFHEEWGPESIGRLAAAHPNNATRIGAALRHAGTRLASLENRQRLVILITDGKPMDTDYDPQTRYAQYDVRKACEENERRNIATFAVSTEENSVADMEIMFPRGHYVILDDISRLPRLLPQLYIGLTV